MYYLKWANLGHGIRTDEGTLRLMKRSKSRISRKRVKTQTSPVRSEKPAIVLRLSKFVTSRPWPIVGVLLILFGAMAWTATRQKCTTFDEIAHLTGGYSHWLTGDYRLNPESGLLPQRWAALPLLLCDVRFPQLDQERWRTSHLWLVGYDFFYSLQNDVTRMLWWGRGMIVLFGMALGGIVYVWSRKLFGGVGAMISLVVYVFSPTLLAHSALITSDLTATLAFVVSLGCLWMVFHRVSLGTLFASALAMGALFISKMSAALILPTALILLAIRLCRGRPKLGLARAASLGNPRNGTARHLARGTLAARARAASETKFAH